MDVEKDRSWTRSGFAISILFCSSHPSATGAFLLIKILKSKAHRASSKGKNVTVAVTETEHLLRIMILATIWRTKVLDYFVA